MPRVHEVAKELGLSSKEVLAKLEEMGIPAKAHTSSIDDAAAERVRAEVGNGAAVGKEATPATIVTASSTPATQTEERPGVVMAPVSRVEKRFTLRKFLKRVGELPVLILVAFLIAVVIKTFLVQAFFIPSGSMLPTLRIGDRVLVEKISFRLGDPDPGDVVVFAKSVFGQPADVPWYKDGINFVRELLGLPTAREEDYIKRVVAVGGDTIRYVGSPRSLFVNGDEVDENYIRGEVDRSSPTLTASDCKRLKMESQDDGCLVPAGKVFVMGDNRGNSMDSRSIGPVDEERIVGRAFVVIWPPSDFGGL